MQDDYNLRLCLHLLSKNCLIRMFQASYMSWKRMQAYLSRILNLLTKVKKIIGQCLPKPTIDLSIDVKWNRL